MKISLFIMLIMMSFTTCYNDWNDYSEYKPVLIEKTALANSISFQPPRQVCQTGKIYFKDNYIFLNEKYCGIHVFDNTNPSAPVNLGFIAIPGSVDIAMKNNVLYVDNAIDLVAIDLSNGLENLTVTKRVTDVFPEHLPPDGKMLRPEFSVENRPANTIVVAWEKIN
jgi:hypothetical protein